MTVVKKRVVIFFLSLIFFSCRSGEKGVVYIWNVSMNVDHANSTESTGSRAHQMRDALRRLGYDPIWVKDPRGLKNFECLICWDVPWASRINDLKKYPREKVILFMWEPPTVLPREYQKDFQDCFSTVYTWDNSLVDNKKYFQFYYPVYGEMPRFNIPFEERELSVMVCRNKNSRYPLSLYGERRKIINFFEHRFCDDFDLYGKGWEPKKLKNYKGAIGSKIGCIRNYKFCFAYENTRDIHGYITEKIFDAFKAGCVPIYWGAKDVTEYIPSGCFIDRRNFGSDEELYWFLKNMSAAEHNKYLDNIALFSQTDQVLLFSFEYFLDIFLNAIEPGYDKQIGLTDRQRAVVDRVYAVFVNSGIKRLDRF